MQPQEIAILDRRLKDDPRGIPHGYEDDELKAVCAQSRDEHARQIAATLLRQRGEQAAEPVTPKPRRGDPAATWRAAAEAHNAQRAREREIERAKTLLREAGEL